MTADTVKSASITTLDGNAANPPAPVQLNTGKGAPGYARQVNDYVAATAAGLADTGSTYKMVRLPTQAFVKSMRLYTKSGLDSSTGLAVDLGSYYSDSTIDGTASANQGTAISATTFMSAVAFGQSGAGSNVDAMSNVDANAKNKPLWDMCGLSSDPGGYIDIVLAVHTAKSGTATAGNIGLDVIFVD